MTNRWRHWLNYIQEIVKNMKLEQYLEAISIPWSIHVDLNMHNIEVIIREQTVCNQGKALMILFIPRDDQYFAILSCDSVDNLLDSAPEILWTPEHKCFISIDKKSYITLEY